MVSCCEGFVFVVAFISTEKNLACPLYHGRKGDYTEELVQAKRIGGLVPLYNVDTRVIGKTSGSVRLAEAEALKLVREKTIVFVPEIYSVYIDTVTGHGRS